MIKIPLMYDGTKTAESIASVPESMLPIVEIFNTLEGEGLWIGQPRVLLRIGGCLVGCKGCDSVHTWTLKQSTLQTLNEIVATVVLTARATRVVSITGGEPMHYPVQVYALARLLREKGFKLNLETSGTILSSFVFGVFDTLSLDIKTPSSGVVVPDEHIQKLIELLVTRPQTQLKAVVTDLADLTWIDEKFGDMLYDGTITLVLTPSTADNAVANRVSMMQDWNISRGYQVRIIPQIHYLLGFR